MILLLVACLGVHDALPYGTTAEDCALCHADHAVEWEASAHARGASSTVFQAMLPEVEAAWGTFARQTCEQCHAPGHGGDEAIGCVSCHAAVGNRGERDGRLAIDLLQPLAGPREVTNGAHTVAPRDFTTSDSMCRTCHVVTGPGLLIETTESAADGTLCLDCHQTDHTFRGFDAELLAQSLAVRIDVLQDGSRELVVTNTSAGHRVPTGVSFVRDLWAEVDGEPGILRIGDQPLRGGVPVALLTDADEVRVGSLAPGEEARMRIGAGSVARLRGRPYRLDLLDALGLDEELSPILEIRSTPATR